VRLTGDVGGLLRQLTPQVLGVVLRRHGGLDLCEDAVQEALAAAAVAWPVEGLPDSPLAWLVTVANRRLVDQVRADRARRGREERIMFGSPAAEAVQRLDDRSDTDRDDTLVLLLLCCHPTLTAPSQIALTLRAVGGLTTAEIAAAFFVPETTMAQRISRAKKAIRDAGATFSLPLPDQLEPRMAALMHVLYLVFNEGYSATSGPDIHRPDLTIEAVRLTRQLHRLRPNDSEIAGLLTLMVLTEARRPARTTSTGELIALAQQDRSLWDHPAIREGIELITAALAEGPIGAYQLQAAIAAVHDEAPRADDTDWAQILALYQTLDQLAPNPMATINRAVAVGMVHGPAAGLELLATVARDDRVADHHLLHAVRAHLLHMTGDNNRAASAFAAAAQRTATIPEKQYLQRRAHELATASHPPPAAQSPATTGLAAVDPCNAS
jgi:RNA polymerase sigma factor (sigma-70 family)